MNSRLIGFVDDCLLMLLNTTASYFNKSAVEHFKDEAYFTKCVLIFEVLSHVGYIDYDIMCNQPQGLA